MNRALFYLIIRSSLGAIRIRLSRLKQPKYLFPALIGLLYFGSIFVPRLLKADPALDVVAALHEKFITMASFGLGFVLCYSWTFDPQRGGLSFSETEAEILFAAPLSRQELVRYHLLRSQPPLIFSSLLLSLIFASITAAPSFLFLILTFFLAMNLLRCMSLVSALAWGAVRGKWNHWPLRLSPPLVFLFSMVLSLPAHWYPFSFSVPSWLPESVLLPLHMIVASGFSATFMLAWPGWIVSIVWIGCCYVACIRLDVVFEENTLAHAKRRMAQQQRRIQAEGVAKPQKERTRTWPPLAASGSLWRAWMWKNLTWIKRTGRIGTFAIIFASIGLIWGYAVISENVAVEMVLAMMLTPFCLIASFLMPPILRVDFRSDLENLELIKTFPISSRELFFSLAGLTTAITAAFQIVLLTLITVILYRTGSLPTEFEAWGLGPLNLFLCGFVLLPVLTGTVVVIENGLILWLPAWFALKAGQNQGHNGIEYMGRGIISILARTLGLALLLLIPGLTTALVLFFFHDPFGRYSLPVAATVGACLLAVETILIAGNVGGLYERLEPGSAELS